MSAKTNFLNFLNEASVQCDDVVSHTWMYGDEKYKPKSGRFYIPSECMKDFRILYSKALKKGVEIKLSERPHGLYTRMYIDIDGTQRVNDIIAELSGFIEKNFNIPDNIKIEKLQNTKNESKYHVHIFQQDDDGELYPLSITKTYMAIIIKHLKEKYDEVDYTKSLRLIGSCKKEGLDKGIYTPGEITQKKLKLFSVIHDDGFDRMISPTHEFKLEQIKKIEAGMKRKDEKAIIEFTDENVVERLNFILPHLKEGKYLDEYSTWFPIVLICRRYGYPMEELDEICNTCENYTPGCVENLYNSYKETSKKSYSIATAQYYLGKYSTEIYDEYKKLFFKPAHGGGWLSKTILTNVWREEVGHADIFCETIDDNMVITDSKSWSGFLWNETKKLWLAVDKAEFVPLISSKLESIFINLVEKAKCDLDNIENEMINDVKNSPESIAHAIEHKKLSIMCSKLTKMLKQSRTVSYLKSLFEIAKVKKYDATFTKKINVSEYFLPIKNGQLIDLRNEEVRDREKSDLFSFECNVGVGDKNHTGVKQFFSDVMGNHDDRVDYLRQILGYCLSGSTRERRFFVFWGAGANGKSVILNIMKAILGDYDTAVSKDIFIKAGRGKDRHVGSVTPELVPLSKGARLAHCSETQMDGKLNDELIKSVSGGDKLVCNPKFKESYEFYSVSKLLLVTNFQPDFNCNDSALLERIVYIPFNTRFEINPTLPTDKQRDVDFVRDLIENHIDDIFAYLLEGSVKYWKNGGFEIPQFFTDMKEEYAEDQDDLQMYIDERIIQKPDGSIQVTKLHADYKRWCYTAGLDELGRRSFVNNILSKGYVKKRTNKGYIIINVEFGRDEEEGDCFERMMG